MAKGLVEKIISSHLLSGSEKAGEEVTIRIDQTLTQDATGTMVYLELEALQIQKIVSELAVSYVDHNTMQAGFENADDHKYLQTAAAKFGAYYSRAGNGVCHQVHLERFTAPGKTLLGADSHTPTAGGAGMFAIGAGGLDVAVAMAKGKYSLSYPRIVRVNLEGALKPWVSAKDVILTILKMLTTKGNVGVVLEYGGSGLESLSVPERAVMTNMGAELGVTTSLFPSDEVTAQFLRAQGREDDWEEFAADKDAQYVRQIDIELGKIIPMISCPHSPDNVVSVESLAGKVVDQVIIGSCTNSSHRDLKISAGILKEKKIHADVSLVIAPGSRQVLKMITDDGILSAFIDAGARIAECACGFCIGIGQAPRSGAVSVRTSNRNFMGRCGTPSASVYLSSPETAAISALSGKITDPRTIGSDKFPCLASPEHFPIDDSMLIPPLSDGSAVEIYRGPNIGSPPQSEPLCEKICGVAAIKVEDKITTDHIMPAGSKLKYRSNIPKYAESVFEGVDPSFSGRCQKNRVGGIANVIVAGLSYGQGSSREHAAICPMYLGVKAVIAKSIERIHRSNLINFGILPLVFKQADDYENIDAGDEIEISDVKDAIKKGGELILKNKTRGVEIKLDYEFTKKELDIIQAGGLLNFLRAEMLS